jgi:hypothetical protein
MDQQQEEALQEQFEKELVALCTEMPFVDLVIKTPDAWVLLSFLQLALRHPEAARMASARTCERMARRLQKLIAATPGTAMHQMAELGWRH